jgi:hypothetical protein
MRYFETDVDTFRLVLAAARAASQQIADATSSPSEIPDGGRYFAAEDARSGFAVVNGDEIVGVFSTERGRGSEIVTEAVAAGGTHLDCFDGYLPSLYGRHGFAEVRREANWTPGEPDVVYMALV